MGDERVQLKLMGISFNPVKKNAFAMLLAEVDGPYRIPVMIGAAEAQSIAIKMEGINPPRPMTHDLFCSFAHAYGVELLEVFIYRFDQGIFSAELVWFDGEREVRIDARTSDAVAIALRLGTPIYTTREILESAGTIFEERDGKLYAKGDVSMFDSNELEPNTDDEENLEQLSEEKLEEKLQACIAEDNYEEAAHISEILKKRRKRD